MRTSRGVKPLPPQATPRNFPLSSFLGAGCQRKRWEGLYAPTPIPQPPLAPRFNGSKYFRGASRKNSALIPHRIFSRREKFPVKKIFVLLPYADRSCLFRGEIDYPKIYFVGPHEFVPPFSLSTQKVTENLQIRTALHLTVISAIPIGCGQGSGHPHPVVVDNVLE